MASKDPVGAFFHDLFADQKRSPTSNRSRATDTREPSWVRPLVPLTAFAAALAVLVWWAPNTLTAPSVTDMYSGATSLASTMTGMRSRMIVLVLMAAAFDALRVVRRRHRRVFAAVCAQTTGAVPRSIRLAPRTTRHSTPRAQLTLSPGTVIDENKLTRLRTAVSSLYDGVPPEVRARARAVAAVDVVVGGRLSGWTGGRSEAWATLGQWEYRVHYSASKATVSITRARVEPDLRSARHRMLAELFDDGKILQNASVSVTDRDEHNDDVGFSISYKQTLATGSDANRLKLTDSLLKVLGEHTSGQLWRIDWQDTDPPAIAISLRAPLPTMAMHRAVLPPAMLPPLGLDHRGIGDQDIPWPSASDTGKRQSGSKAHVLSGRRLHVPYATCEQVDGSLVEAFWNISDRSSAPHMLVVGPTGGGKTVLLTTVITELVLRGVPVIGVDPKRIELHQFLGYPGVPAIVFDTLRAALLIEALHAEMMARTKYMQALRIKPRNMPPLVAVLDEFFILSAAWSHMARSGSELEKEMIKRADPLGKIGQLVALARSTGIRLAVGVQRPDAQLFGKDSGGVRDNFKTRASLARLSSDGALMMWGDTTVGRDLDARVPGRASVTNASGDPALAQVWYTPTVDTHPAARAEMSATEIEAVESLLPTTDAAVYCFSEELPAFLAEEQALIAVMGEDVRDPVAVTAGTARVEVEARYAIADTIADGVAANSLESGMSIVLDLPDEPQRNVVIADVEIVRPVERDKATGAVIDEGEVRIQIAAATTGSRAAVDVITYSGLDTVMLAAPDLAPTPT